MIVRVIILVGLLAAFQLDGIAVAKDQIQDIEAKVVRVYATKKSGYYHKPWKSPDFSSVRGSAFFFSDEVNFPGRRGLILTNAHTVAQAPSLNISNGREKRRYKVKCLGIMDLADFAVLQLEPGELEVYEKRNGRIAPLELGDSDTLRVGDRVLGWGYPLGGEAISKSEAGEISRIEVNRYAYSEEYWLMVQASLQQNGGNSGGPVIKDAKVIGLAFQGIEASDRINYFIPINLVKQLLPLIDRPKQVPRWRCMVQQHMFPRLKDFYNLDQDHGGVLLDYFVPGDGPYAFGLRAGDILVEIDRHEIDNFGEVYFKPLGQKVYFGEVLNRKKIGDPLSVKVIRDGAPLDIAGAMVQGLPRLVPKAFTDANYFIFDGIGFVELTQNCITNLGKSGTPFQERYGSEFPKKAYQKIVVISEIFPEYGLVKTDQYLKRVEKINGEEVLNISHLYDIIESLKRKGEKKALLEIEGNLRLPLDLGGAEGLDKKIKDQYGILYMRTPGEFTP
ncbi:MAG: trypsin-like peptidase domain-containing protein [Pseudomonadota bacterium]